MFKEEEIKKMSVEEMIKAIIEQTDYTKIVNEVLKIVNSNINS